MKLKEWLDKQLGTKKEFAEKIGVSRYTLYKYLNGEATPRLEIALRIQKVTNGEVRVEDLIKT
jgi:DNA-binding XRE family transcriptional regulator